MTAPLTKEEVDAIRARLAAATPGPWLQFPRHGEIRMSFGGFEDGAEMKGYSFWSHFRPADAAFVCAAREVDELLAEQLEREKEAEAQRIADLNQLKLFTDEVKP